MMPKDRYTVSLPIPSRKLSPNGRLHHYARAQANKNARYWGKMATLAALSPTTNNSRPMWQEAEVSIRVVKPNKRNIMDDQNLIAACKAHHRANHHCHLHIQGDPYSGLTFTNANGKPICAQPPITPSESSPERLTDDAQTHGMTDPEQQRLGPVGGKLQRWAILPWPKPIPPRTPNLTPITPVPSETGVNIPPTLVRRE